MTRTETSVGVTWLRLIGSVLTLAAAAGVLATAALARPASPKLVGNPTAGVSTFTSTCGVCHTMKAAKTAGTIGPNLDATASKLTEAQIIKAISLGGASVMTKAALAKYPTRMVAYKGTLSTTDIQNVAAYVFTSTHAGASSGGTTAPATVKVALKAAGHKPKIGVHWPYVVHATSGGKPAAGKITVQIVDPTGKAHPVQYGKSKQNIIKRPFKGVFKDFAIWPKSSKGIPLTFRVTVLVGKTKNVTNYKVTPRA